jgi:protein-L-isoaspartate(D-aspartate) O-methyltransferase
MTEMLDPQPKDAVLEIGTGSGYQAAVLSGLVKDVYTIEIVELLGRNAAKVLKEYPNVHTKIGDGYQGWPEHAPFDKIIVTCSPEDVPRPLVEQLKEGGKMIIPLGERYEQVFFMFEKQQGKLVKTRLLPALFVPMTGDAEKNRKVQPDPKNPQLHNGGFEIDTEGDGHPVGWHYQRQLTLETRGAPEGKNFVKFENKDPGRNAIMLQGLAIDGRAVSTIKVSIQARGDEIRNNGPNEQAAFIIQYFDSDRRPLEIDTIATFDGTFGWKRVSKTLHVPAKSREAIVRVGLAGAVGELDIDDVRITK